MEAAAAEGHSPADEDSYPVDMEDLEEGDDRYPVYA